MPINVTIASVKPEAQRESLQSFIDSLDLESVFAGLDQRAVLECANRTRLDIPTVQKSMTCQKVLDLYTASTAELLDEAKLECTL